jgi:hypothetical protein
MFKLGEDHFPYCYDCGSRHVFTLHAALAVAIGSINGRDDFRIPAAYRDILRDGVAQLERYALQRWGRRLDLQTVEDIACDLCKLRDDLRVSIPGLATYDDLDAAFALPLTEAVGTLRSVAVPAVRDLQPWPAVSNPLKASLIWSLLDPQSPLCDPEGPFCRSPELMADQKRVVNRMEALGLKSIADLKHYFLEQFGYPFPEAISFKRLAELLEIEPTATVPPKRVAVAPTKHRKKRVKGKRIDERMMAIIRDNEESIYWSSNEWAWHLKCAGSTVKESRTWKTVCNPARERERLARGRRLRGPKKRRPRPEDGSREG